MSTDVAAAGTLSASDARVDVRLALEHDWNLVADPVQLWHLVPSWDSTRSALCGARVARRPPLVPVEAAPVCGDCRQLWLG